MTDSFVAQGLRPSTRVLTAVASAIVLAGCSTVAGPQVGGRGSSSDAALSSGFAPLVVHGADNNLAGAMKGRKVVSGAQQVAAEGVKALDAHDYKKANDLFNLALKMDIQNPSLHFLNALAYHYRALEGEGALYAMAEQGYALTVQYDSSHVAARHHLGLVYLEKRDFSAAKVQLSEAALYAPDDADLLYDLAFSAYYAKDVKTAYAAIQGLMQLGGQPSAQALRARAIIAAAAGDAASAGVALSELGAMPGSASGNAPRRVREWNQSWAQGGFLKTQFSSGALPTPPAGAAAAGQRPGQSGGANTVPGGFIGAPLVGQSRGVGDFVEKQMVLVDVVIASVEEDNGNTMGVNLMEGLKVNFGGIGQPAWTRGFEQRVDLLNGGIVSSGQAVTRNISAAGVGYTLNIANARERNSEVLARPTLLALGGQTSQFFSGVDVVGAAVSSGQGSSVQIQKEVGVKLSVTPEFLPDNLIRLNVTAERTFLTNPNSNVVFDFRLDTTKTIVNANVALKYGETVILSGLSERDKSNDINGVPLLRDVPVVQYLFSRNTERDYMKSVLVLLTPRRPQYLHRAESDIKDDRQKMSDADRIQSELEAKNQLWFKPVPNSAVALSGLSDSSMFREFRAGDLEMPSWVSRKSHAGRIRGVLHYLFY